jgi:hypothetical protein
MAGHVYQRRKKAYARHIVSLLWCETRSRERSLTKITSLRCSKGKWNNKNFHARSVRIWFPHVPEKLFKYTYNMLSIDIEFIK